MFAVDCHMLSHKHNTRRMAQQYYEYVNYKEEHVQEQKKLPKGACHKYIIIFQSVFNIIFHVSLHRCRRCLLTNALIHFMCCAEQMGAMC